jgi:hypothetical protein
MLRSVLRRIDFLFFNNLLTRNYRVQSLSYVLKLRTIGFGALFFIEAKNIFAKLSSSSIFEWIYGGVEVKYNFCMIKNLNFS